MEVLDIARWQFGIITVYHFLFVPLTIGLTAIVAGLQTTWLVTKKQEYLRLTKFFGKLMLINFALGIVTGIVQEFQFGMNWSDYSRFVGDVFGAPLAVEGLLAFFLESTFLGLWIFGWDKLPRALHASCMWIVHLGTLASSWFILAANSWMQHPVGYEYDAETGRAQLTDFWAVMFNKVQLVTFPHVILASYLTAGAFMVAVAAWLHRKHRRAEAQLSTTEQAEALSTGPGYTESSMYRKAMRIGAVITLVAGLGVAVSGDFQGKVMTEVQPMKMAAAEGLYETESTAPFSVLTWGKLDGSEATPIIEIHGLLSFLGTGSFNGTVEGINPLREKYAETYGTDPGATYYSADYTPIIPVTYWSFRAMMGFGMFAAMAAGLILFLTRKGRAPAGKWFTVMAIAMPLGALAGNSFGWIFTEMGRQPWAVYGLMTTEHAVSPGVSTTEAWISLIALTSLYAILAVIEVKLLLTYIKKGAEPFVEPPDVPIGGDKNSDAPMAFAY